MKKMFIAISLLFSLTLTSANAVVVTQEAKITGLYVAFFNRAADQAGLEYWTTTADNVAKQGGDVSSVFKTLASGFATHPTFKSTYDPLSDEEFVKAIYRNSLGRDGDAEGIAYWTDLVERVMSRSDMVATFVELSMVTDLTPANYPSLSAEELAAAQLRQDLITNKVTVALAFTHQLGTLSNVVDNDEPESDPAYIASIMIISGVTETEATVLNATGFLEGIIGTDNPIGQINTSNSLGGSIAYIVEKDANNKIFMEKADNGDFITTEMKDGKYTTTKILVNGDTNVFEIEYQADGISLTYKGETEFININDTTQDQEIESQYIGIWREDVDENWIGDIDIAYIYTDKAIVFSGNIATNACSQTRTLNVSEFQSLLKNDIDVNDYVMATTYKSRIETACGSYLSLNATVSRKSILDYLTTSDEKRDTDLESNFNDVVDSSRRGPIDGLYGATVAGTLVDKVTDKIRSKENWWVIRGVVQIYDKLKALPKRIATVVGDTVDVASAIYDNISGKNNSNDVSGIKDAVDDFEDNSYIDNGNPFVDSTFRYAEKDENGEIEVVESISYDSENKKVEEIPNYDEYGEIVSITKRTYLGDDAFGAVYEEEIIKIGINDTDIGNSSEFYFKYSLGGQEFNVSPSVYYKTWKDCDRYREGDQPSLYFNSGDFSGGHDMTMSIVMDSEDDSGDKSGKVYLLVYEYNSNAWSLGGIVTSEIKSNETSIAGSFSATLRKSDLNDPNSEETIEISGTFNFPKNQVSITSQYTTCRYYNSSLTLDDGEW